MSNSTQKISVVEKIGYSLGDLAANLIFQTLMTFLAFFTPMFTRSLLPLLLS